MYVHMSHYAKTWIVDDSQAESERNLRATEDLSHHTATALDL